MARLFDDGATEYLEVQSTPITAAPLTMSCWAYTNDLSLAQCIMWVGDKDSTGDFWSLEIERAIAGGWAQMRAHDGPGAGASTSVAVTANVWHHFCGVEIAFNSRAVYLDGGGKGTDVTEKTPDDADSAAIARRNDTSPINYWSGGIAEAGIWNVALTDAEVAILAAGFSPLFVRPESLVAYWPLIRDEDQDRVGGYDMTAFNTPSIAAHPPVIYPAPMMFYPPASAAPAPGGQPMQLRGTNVLHLRQWHPRVTS